MKTIKVNNLTSYKQCSPQTILNTIEAAKAYDRQLIEANFSDFVQQHTVTESEMIARFNQYGWNQ
jgi:hypothetical protein